MLETQKADSINAYLEESVNIVSIVFSDKSKSNVHISDFVDEHYTEKSIKETTNSSLKWGHIAISNQKRNFLGVYQKIEGKHLQLYINEFCYKLNTRYFTNLLFKRLSIALACSKDYVSGAHIRLKLIYESNIYQFYSLIITSRIHISKFNLHFSS